MKRLGTKNLSFGRSYENFEVSPAKSIWRSFAQKWPKSAYIKACIKRNLNNTMQNLTCTSILVYLMSANSFCGLQTEVAVLGGGEIES